MINVLFLNIYDYLWYLFIYIDDIDDIQDIIQENINHISL